MSRLTNLLRELEKSNPQLAADLGREITTLSDRRAFGLNFERHVPESVELPGRPIRRGDKVRFLPERGESPGSIDDRLWRVVRVKKNGKGRVAELAPLVGDSGSERVSRDTDDLVAVAEFRDPIYPGLVSTGRIERGGDKPFHTVINAENYHALEALLYTHEGAVDAIYIDPPYNTGAKDWKYNNDYVDGEDRYRHSKWLAMIERRLLLAKRLLNPESSVLIVTIDEKEYLRLGLLLEQLFPANDIQMVASAINPKGSSRPGRFSRTDEYLFWVFLGDAAVIPWRSDMLRDPAGGAGSDQVRWAGLVRSGSNSRREDRPNLFYPIYLDAESGRVIEVGESIPPDVPRESVSQRDGREVAWPLRSDGGEATWQVHPSSLRQLFEQGFARVGSKSSRTGRRTFSYLPAGTRKRIADGDITIVGRGEDGAAILRWTSGARIVKPLTLWNQVSHSASEYGVAVLKSLIPGRRFPFPKSLYAVEDALRFVLAQKPDAVVVDFFAGSGTTAHAVMRLNRQDGGRRSSILVTNNEVSLDEQSELRVRGLRPGDPDWEAHGICEYITKPRLEATLTGRTPGGETVKGEYRFTDEFAMAEGFSENAEFFKMTYEAPLAVAHNHAFERIAPLLWLRAGAEGSRVDQVAKEGFAVADVYGVLFDVDRSDAFVAEAWEKPGMRVAFIVSDDESAFQSVCAELPDSVEGVRLYSSYLSNFEINARAEQQ